MTESSLIGAVDYLTPWGVHGWVYDNTDPDVPVRVEALVDGRVIGATVADIDRPDLSGTVGRIGRFGFIIKFSADIETDAPIVVRAIGPSGTREIDNASWSQIEGYVEYIGRGEARGWAWMPQQPDAFLEIELRASGVLLASAIASDQRPDLRIAGRGSGLYGFELKHNQIPIFDPTLEIMAKRGDILTRLPILNREDTENSAIWPSDLYEMEEVESNNDSLHLFTDQPVNQDEADRVDSSEDSFLRFDEGTSKEDLPAPRITSNPQERVRQKIVRVGGEVVTAASVDRIVRCGDGLIVAGWTINCLDIFLHESENSDASGPGRVEWFSRNDVAAAYGKSASDARGFLVMWRQAPAEDFSLSFSPTEADSFILNISIGNADHEKDSISALLADNNRRLGLILDFFQHCPEIVKSISEKIQPNPQTSSRVRGHLEQARGIPSEGGLVVGWIIHLPGISTYLVDTEGHLVATGEATRISREDVVQAMHDSFGRHTRNAGFLQRWPYELKAGGELRLIAIVDNGIVLLSMIQWSLAPADPISFARWSFSIPSPRESFHERLDLHDGPLIDALIRQSHEERGALKPIENNYGTPNETPICSIIVPLYRRFDFLLNQFLTFENDVTIRQKCDLIYVVDDPSIVGPLAAECERLYRCHSVPFRTVWAGDNLGFAGANNLGVSVSRSDMILLMNSDVIPGSPGWLDQMIEAYKLKSDAGILGARLFYPGGGIQHDGMTFKWASDWGAYLNKHPGAGLDLRVDEDQPVNRLAVTAALMLIKRDLYNAVGGLDDSYLIGDFEDSDLCLKVRTLGLRISCLQSINKVVHLERQSFSSIGAPSFRELVARYNARRHQRRWGSYISKIIGQRLDQQ